MRGSKFPARSALSAEFRAFVEASNDEVSQWLGGNIGVICADSNAATAADSTAASTAQVE